MTVETSLCDTPVIRRLSDIFTTMWIQFLVTIPRIHTLFGYRWSESIQTELLHMVYLANFASKFQSSTMVKYKEVFCIAGFVYSRKTVSDL